MPNMRTTALMRPGGVLFVALLSLATTSATAQTLKLTGLGSAPVELTVAAVEAMGLAEIKDTRQLSVGSQTEQREIVYQGVTLPRLLDAAGFDKLDRYKVRAATILVLAKDGYQATFSWGELFNSPGGERVLLILRENGAVSAREGPFSLRTFGDFRPGPRHVREAAEIRVLLP